MKLVAFGEFLSENLGDRVIFESMKLSFSRNHVILDPIDISGRILSSARKHDREKSTLKPNLILLLLRKIFRRILLLKKSWSIIRWFVFQRSKVLQRWEESIRASDGIVIGGGQLITDRGFMFPVRVFEVYRLARKNRKPLAIFGCGVDPNIGFLARWIYKEVFRYATYISVRDNGSRTAMEKLLGKSNKKIDVIPDPAFVASGIYSNNDRSKLRSPSVSFVLQPAEHFRIFVKSLGKMTDQEYSQFWASIIKKTVDSGFSVAMMCNGESGDYEALLAVSFELRKRGVAHRVLEPPKTAKDLIKNISSFDRIVATRMHAGIVAYSCGVSVLPVAWDRKVVNVWRSTDPTVKVIAGDVVGSERAKRDIVSWITTGHNADFNYTHESAVNSAIIDCISALVPSFTGVGSKDFSRDQS